MMFQFLTGLDGCMCGVEAYFDRLVCAAGNGSVILDILVLLSVAIVSATRSLFCG